MMSKKSQRELSPREQARQVTRDLFHGKVKPGEAAERLADQGWNVKLVERKEGFVLDANKSAE